MEKYRINNDEFREMWEIPAEASKMPPQTGRLDVLYLVIA